MLRVVSPAKLSPAQREVVRRAADVLVFADGKGQAQETLAALDSLIGLSTALLDSGQWSRSQVRWFMDDLWACGPAQVLEPSSPVPAPPVLVRAGECIGPPELERAGRTSAFDS
jgi:hypothetical protein